MRPPIDMRLNPAKDLADLLGGSGVFKDRGHLLLDFEREAEKLGKTKADAQRLFAVLPPDLRQVPTMTSFDGKRRYFYGGVYDIGKTPGFVGTEQFPEVASLFAALSLFDEIGNGPGKAEWLAKIGCTSRHAAALAETEPALRTDLGTVIAYEVGGAGTKKIDWQFSAPNGRRMLLDVKFRDCDQINFFEQIGSGIPEHQIIPPNPLLLFRGTVEKFVCADSAFSLQGVWITSGIAFDELHFNAVFAQLNSSRLHFAIFPLGSDEAFVIARRHEDVDFILNFFHLSFTKRFFRQQ